MAFLARILSGAEELLKSEKSPVRINADELEEFARNLPDLDNGSPRKFPLRFDSQLIEINFLSTLHLLNFGSSLQREIYAATGRGVFSTISYGVMCMHIGGSTLSASEFAAMSIQDVAQAFGLPLHIDVPHESGAFTYSQPSPVRPLLDAIKETLHETAAALHRLGYLTLGHFVLDTVKSDRTANGLVERLVHEFPAFNDTALIDSIELTFARKAQLLTADLHRHFASNADRLFDFPDIDQLSVAPGSLIPALLTRFNLITVTDDQLSRQIQQEEAVSERSSGYLRSASIVACASIVRARSSSALTTRALDHYLSCVVAKQKLSVSQEKHRNLNTVAY